MNASRDLLEALGLRAGEALLSIVGGGGKSALLFRLGELLPGRPVLTTTTRIFASQIERAPAWVAAENPEELAAALSRGTPGLLVVGEVEGDKALGVPRELPARLLAHPAVDSVVVEADGSRMRPAKAPAEHEPVIPAETRVLIPVVGIDALAGPIAERTHRPERVSALTGVAPDQPLSPEDLGVLLSHPQGGLRHAPAGARVVALINKVETDADRELAERVARSALAAGGLERVVAGALERGDAADFCVYGAQ